MSSSKITPSSARRGSAKPPAAQRRGYPFGAIRWQSEQNPTEQDWDFTAQRLERGFGLLDYRARMYDPAIGRFVSADSVVPDFGNPQDLNRYSYVRNSPLNYVDPTGHLTEDELATYFGHSSQGLRDAGWQDFLVDWLIDPETQFGDVFSYEGENGNTSEAMLALFETVEAGSGIYIGGFYGLNGAMKGQEVARANIFSLNDSSPDAVRLEEKYKDSFDELPRIAGTDGRNYYDPVMHSQLTVEEHGGALIASVGVVAVVAGCLSGGFPACLGTGWGAFSTGTMLLGGLHTAIFRPNTIDYPLLRVPSLYGNAPQLYRFNTPAGYYDYY